MLSNNPPPSNPLYYNSTQPMALPRERGLPLLPSSYIDPEHNRYMPSASTYRRDSPPPPVSSYRTDRSIDYPPRTTNNDLYMRGDYRPLSPPSLASLSVRGDSYRSNEYGSRSERYDTPRKSFSLLLLTPYC
jgi:hypothetical protein